MSFLYCFLGFYMVQVDLSSNLLSELPETFGNLHVLKVCTCVIDSLLSPFILSTSTLFPFHCELDSYGKFSP